MDLNIQNVEKISVGKKTLVDDRSFYYRKITITHKLWDNNTGKYATVETHIDVLATSTTFGDKLSLKELKKRLDIIESDA